ncbi:Lrp/AsnC family transcriptional regulator [Candidatus Bathyarchaeota archaeon]|nr:Lrp/AsnC family transcriptional regulator [Candidatus Bathyarchaeota archaeon]
MEELTRKTQQLLKMLHDKGRSANTFTLHIKQNDLATQLGISRQALNVHLRKLRDFGYIRTGRGFIDVTEKGLNALGLSATPAFILIRASPIKRIQVYDKIKELPVQRAFRIAGDFDAVIMVEREKLDETLKKIYSVDGIQDTRSYVTIETIK